MELGSVPAAPSPDGVPQVTRNQPDPAGGPSRTALIACGALSRDLGILLADGRLGVDVYALPPQLHNQPASIASAVAAQADALDGGYDRIVVGYADCGSYGALDELCAARGWSRLAGLHCYDLYAGPSRIRELVEGEPGTYLLTDFLVRTFHRLVVRSLGLDRYPELRADYFGHYTRVVWLQTDPDLLPAAQAAAGVLGLPLVVEPVGLAGLDRALGALLGETGATAGAPGPRRHDVTLPSSG